MKELLDKLSSYNVFNYLLPGIVFVVIADVTTSVNLVQKDIVLGVFLYYFIGLTISRLGSLIIEPALKQCKFVIFASYNDFVSASDKDKLIEVMSEANNMYRTFIAVFAALLALKLFDYLFSSFLGLGQWTNELALTALLVLFGFSYRKQTQYICRRVSRVVGKE